MIIVCFAAFAPQLISDPGQVETVLSRETREVVIECRFFGSPIPEITWDGAPMQGIVYEVLKTDPSGSSKLVIKGSSSNSCSCSH